MKGYIFQKKDFFKKSKEELFSVGFPDVLQVFLRKNRETEMVILVTGCDDSDVPKEEAERVMKREFPSEEKRLEIIEESKHRNIYAVLPVSEEK
jgi:hypothetical protein